MIWLKFIYPALSRLIEKLPRKTGTILVNCMIVFMIFNMAISSLALARYTQRNTVEAASAKNAKDAQTTDGEEDSFLDDFLDEHFPNERMERIYPNAKIVPKS